MALKSRFKEWLRRAKTKSQTHTKGTADQTRKFSVEPNLTTDNKTSMLINRYLATPNAHSLSTKSDVTKTIKVLAASKLDPGTLNHPPSTTTVTIQTKDVAKVDDTHVLRTEDNLPASKVGATASSTTMIDTQSATINDHSPSKTDTVLNDSQSGLSKGRSPTTKQRSKVSQSLSLLTGVKSIKTKHSSVNTEAQAPHAPKAALEKRDSLLDLLKSHEYGNVSDLHWALGRACYRGHVDVATKLIARGVSLSELSRYQPVSSKPLGTPLHLAVLGNQPGIISIIAKHMEHVDPRDADEHTPLHRVTSTELANILLEHGADVNSKNVSGQTPLHHVRSSEIAKVLLEKGADVHIRDKFGRSPLHYAQDEAIVSVLLDNGADVNCADPSGATLLHHAKTPEVAETLLKYGADVNIADNAGRTPLHHTQREDIIKLLLEFGANPNNRGPDGQALIHSAKTRSLMTLLLEHGADVNLKDESGRTALHYVKDGDIANMLLEKGAEVDSRDNWGKTPLHSAAREHRVTCLVTLLRNGADVNAACDFGLTPLLVVGESNWNFIDILLSYGANVNVKDTEGRCLIHRVCLKGPSDLLDTLLIKGADVHARDARGQTPLYYAIDGAKHKILKILLAHGARCDITDFQGRTPLDWADEMEREYSAILIRRHMGLYAKPLQRPSEVSEVLSYRYAQRDGQSTHFDPGPPRSIYEAATGLTDPMILRWD